MPAFPLQGGVSVRSTHSLITACGMAQTCFTRVESGEVVVKLRGTEIVRVSAAGDVTLDAGGKRAVSTGSHTSLLCQPLHTCTLCPHIALFL